MKFSVLKSLLYHHHSPTTPGLTYFPVDHRHKYVSNISCQKIPRRKLLIYSLEFLGIFNETTKSSCYYACLGALVMNWVLPKKSGEKVLKSYMYYVVMKKKLMQFDEINNCLSQSLKSMCF